MNFSFLMCKMWVIIAQGGYLVENVVKMKG